MNRRIQGLEMEASFAAIDELSLRGQVGYITLATRTSPALLAMAARRRPKAVLAVCKT